MLRDFFARLLPSDIVAYIPGAKLVAGAILYIAAEVFGVTGEVTEVFGVEIHLPEVAAFLGFYLWPSGSRREP